MSHTLHRQGKKEDLAHDFPVLSRTANGINREGSREMLTEFVKLAFKHNPINLGNHNGNMYALSECEICGKITEGRGSNVVFGSKEDVAAFVRDLQEAGYSYSVTVSGLEDSVREICRECGLKLHSVNLSLGVWGKTELLPPADVLEIITMCGHHQVSGFLVQTLAVQIHAGKITVEQAAEILVRPCPCGVVNTVRAKQILKRMAEQLS